VGIPKYRFAVGDINGEIEIVKRLGVEIKTNNRYRKKIISLDDLFNQGLKRHLSQIGGPYKSKLRIPGEEAEGLSMVLISFVT